MSERDRIYSLLSSLDAGVVLAVAGISVYRQHDRLYTVEGAGPYRADQAIEEVLRRAHQARP